MNAAVQGRSPAIGQRLAPSSRHVDVGLRLLAAGPGLQRLRWSTDPDAPAAHTLCEGEVRLVVRWVEMRAADLQASRARRLHPRDAASDDWHYLAGAGVGVVEESRVAGCAVGAIIRGLLPLGTHCVIRVLSMDAHGLTANAARDQASAVMRYAWCAGPLQPAAATGLEAVEHALAALRDQAHGSAGSATMSLSGARSSCDASAPITVASCLYS